MIVCISGGIGLSRAGREDRWLTDLLHQLQPLPGHHEPRRAPELEGG